MLHLFGAPDVADAKPPEVLEVAGVEVDDDDGDGDIPNIDVDLGSGQAEVDGATGDATGGADSSAGQRVAKDEAASSSKAPEAPKGDPTRETGGARAGGFRNRWRRW